MRVLCIHFTNIAFCSSSLTAAAAAELCKDDQCKDDIRGLNGTETLPELSADSVELSCCWVCDQSRCVSDGRQASPTALITEMNPSIIVLLDD